MPLPACLEALQQHQYVRGLEYFLPYLYDAPTTVLDYLPAGAIIVIDEPTHLSDEYQHYLQDMTEISLARLDQGLLLPLPAPLHLPLESMQATLLAASDPGDEPAGSGRSTPGGLAGHRRGPARWSMRPATWSASRKTCSAARRPASGC